MPKIDPPSTLAAAGKALWGDVSSRYDLRPDELAILENACAATDMIDALSKAWVAEGSPSTTKGSMGQEVIHPLIGEIRVQRAYRDQALSRLKLPDEQAASGGAGEDTSAKARKAAVARWSRGA